MTNTRWNDDRIERSFERLLEAQTATQIQLDRLVTNTTQFQASTNEQLEFLGQIMGQLIVKQEESDRRHEENEERFNVLLGEVRALGHRIDSVLGLLNTNGHGGNG
jgi:ABC-type transporter Mla subunit MlaD